MRNEAANMPMGESAPLGPEGASLLPGPGWFITACGKEMERKKRRKKLPFLHDITLFLFVGKRVCALFWFSVVWSRRSNFFVLFYFVCGMKELISVGLSVEVGKSWLI